MTDELYKQILDELYDKIDYMKENQFPEEQLKKTAEITDRFAREEKPLK